MNPLAVLALLLFCVSSALGQARQVFQADADWIPIRWEPARTVAGSALDFSFTADAPAGKHGAAIVKDGQLVFKDAPERPVHLYGAVVSHGLPFLDKAHCEQLAESLAANGYNGVRLHNYNFAKGVMKEVGSAEFTAEAQDQLDYLFFCLKQRGIYFTFPLNAWGFFKAGDAKDVPEFRDRPFRFESNGLLPISVELQKWFKDYSRNLLGHVNPYTKLALKDDPALLTLELANESSLLAVLGQYPDLVPIYRRLCRDDLQAKLGHEPAAEEIEKALPAFVMRQQEKYAAAMTTFLRELGVKQPLTDSNFRDNLVYALPRAQMDYVDVHGYWALYHNLTGSPTSGDPNYRQSWVNPNTVNWGIFLATVPCRLFGQPYMNSEFNGCYPSPYWLFTGPAEAILAGGQGWNGVFRCGLGAHQERYFSPSSLRRIETGNSPIMMLSERIGAMLFSEGEMKPLPAQVPFAVTPEYILSKLDLPGGPKIPPSYAQLAFRYRLGIVLLNGSERLDKYPCVVVPPDMERPASLVGKEVLTADANLAARLAELLPADDAGATVPRFDAAAGTGQLVTPKTETFLLPAEVVHAEGKIVRLTGNHTVSVCFAGSLDGRSLAESNRVLALYLTDTKNSGTEVEYDDKPKGNVIVLKPGDLPLLVHQGAIEMTFLAKGRPLPEVWALKYDGSRAVKVDPHQTADGFSFTAQAVTNAETFSAFELVWPPTK